METSHSHTFASHISSPHRTLLNTLRTWNSSGLLGMVAERVAVLNDPLPSEHAMALQHGFQVLQPKDVPGGKVSCRTELYRVSCVYLSIYATLRGIMRYGTRVSFVFFTIINSLSCATIDGEEQCVHHRRCLLLHPAARQV